MLYNFKGKNIRIPDDEIERNISILGISQDEAIEMWLSDNDYLDNETIENLSEKAKKNKIQHEARNINKTTIRKAREKAPDAEKENLISFFADCLKNASIPAEIVNKSKLITFKVNDSYFKLDLIRQRQPKQ